MTDRHSCPRPAIGPILITGAGGMLGTALSRLCSGMGEGWVGYAKADLDIKDAAAVQKAISEFALTGGRLVVNAAAYTDVERAEVEQEQAFATNDGGARNVAEAAAGCGLGLVHVSTDFVFDGTKQTPYTEEDEPNPLNVYGRSKLAGELSVAAAHPNALIVRSAWVYGPGGTDFPSKILQLAQRSERVQVVNDEMGSPTSSADLARGALALHRRGATGLFHLVASGCCSRYEMARDIATTLTLPARMMPVSREALPITVMRPANAVLSAEKAARLGVEMPWWRDSLHAYVRDYLGKAT